ncbi:transposase [Tenacibaculum sp. UWU-22]|uniref:ISAon1 family transposase n=1 Tax=Tenacibaculum sp. UWU-22 TaxID=3234187 RepID=UPI0034DB52B0
MVSTHSNDCHTIAKFYKLDGKKLQRQFKKHLSDFKQWKEKPHAKDRLIFPENIGKQLSIDEVALSKGKLYTIVTNKKAKGKAGSIVAIIATTKAEYAIDKLLKISDSKRNTVKEITLDMANSMKLIAKKCFPKATQVTDRFHVQKLALDALQDIRIKYRWETIDQENNDIKKAKTNNKTYTAETFTNGDTLKQLLARSRYLLYKTRNDWTQKQQQRAAILFKNYPDIKKAYGICQKLRNLFNNKTISKEIAYTKLAHWFKEVEQSGFKAFNIVANSIALNYQSILNYFDNRSTNASAESFNAKIKAFRTQFRGVRNVEFFLYRLTQIFA